MWSIAEYLERKLHSKQQAGNVWYANWMNLQEHLKTTNNRYLNSFPKSCELEDWYFCFIDQPALPLCTQKLVASLWVMVIIGWFAGTIYGQTHLCHPISQETCQKPCQWSTQPSSPWSNPRHLGPLAACSAGKACGTSIFWVKNWAQGAPSLYALNMQVCPTW